MSYDIGPKIGIEGENTFKAALRGINAQMKNLSAEMKAMAASFDKTDQQEKKLAAQNQVLEKSIEAAKAKISILTSEYDKQKAKLDELGNALEQAKQEYGEQSNEAAKAQNAYNRQAAAVNSLGAQLHNATADLRGMESQLSANNQALEEVANAADKASDEVKKVGDSSKDAEKKTSGFLDTLKANLTADAIEAGLSAIKNALQSFVKEVVSVGTEYQTAFNSIKVQTGATAKEMESLGGVMKDVYAGNFGEDMNDVADALSQVARQLGEGLDGKALQGLTKDAITLRDAFGYDVPESVRAAKAMMDQFGISAEDAFGLIAKGAQNNLDFSGELIDNISEYSVQFGKLGLSAQDMFGIFQSGAEAGAWNLDKIGDAVKEFSIRAIDGSNTTQDGFQRLGMNADEMAKKFAAGGDTAREAFLQVIAGLRDMDDPVSQSIAGVDLFGTMWEDLGPEVVTQLGNIKDGYDDAAAAMDQISADRYNDFGAVMQELGRTVQVDFLMPIAEQLLPKLQEVAKRLKEAFADPAMQSSIQNIAGAVADFADGVASFAEDSLPGLLDGLSWVLENASGIATGIAAIGGAIAGLKIGSILTVATESFKKFKLAQEGATAAQWLLNAAQNANPMMVIPTIIAAVVSALIVLWNTNEDFRNAVIGAWEAIKQTASDVWGGIVTFFTETIPEAWNSVVAFFESAPEFFSGVWESIQNSFTEGWNNVVAFFTESIPAWLESVGTWFDELPYKLGYALGEALAKAQEWGANMLAFVTETIPQIIQNIVDWFAQLPGRIWTWLTDTVQKLIAWGTQMVETGRAKAAETVEAVAGWFAQLPGRILTWLTETVQKITAWGGEMVENARAKAQAVVDTVVTKFQELPGKVKEIGANIITGFWEGLQSKIEWVKSKVADFVQGVKDGFTNAQAFDTHSPSKWAMRIGGFIMQGLAIGMKSGTDSAIDAAQQAAGRIKTAIERKIEAINAEIEKIQQKADERKAAEELASYKKSLEDKYAELEKAETKNRQKILDEIAKLESDWNKKRVEKAEAAAKEAKTAQLKVLQAFQKEYESALSKIESAQDSMVKKLANYGDLFTMVKQDKGEYLQLGDLQKDIDKINAYGDALDRLQERGISDSLMDEIIGMSVDDALAYTKQLLNMTDDNYAQYMELWERKQAEAQKIAQRFYKSEFEELRQEFIDKVPMEMGELKDQMQTLGEQSAMGLAKGFARMQEYVTTTFVSVVQAARRAAAQSEEIHSPSRKWARLGGYMAQGLGVGFLDKMRTVAQQITDSIPAPAAPQITAYQRASEATVNGIAAAVQSGGMGGRIVVEVPVYLDGREVTRVVADHWPQVNRQRGVALG